MASQKEQQLQKENEELRKQLDSAKKEGVVAIPVKGSYMAQWTNQLTGDTMQRKVEFQAGAQGVRLRGHNGIFPTEGVLAIANGKKATKDQIEKCPELEGIDAEFAAKELTHLAIINYGLLKDHPAEKVAGDTPDK